MSKLPLRVGLTSSSQPRGGNSQGEEEFCPPPPPPRHWDWGTRSAVRTDPSGLGRAALVAVYVSQMPGALGSGGARAPISRGSSGWHST